MMRMKSLLLLGTALAFALPAVPRAQAQGLQVAQAGGEKKDEKEKPGQHKAPPQRPHAAPPQRPAPPPQHAAPPQRPAPPPQHAAPPQRPVPPPQHAAPPQRPAQPAPAQRPVQAPHPAPQRPVQAPQQRAPERPAQTAPRPGAPEHRPAEAPRRPGTPERKPAQVAPPQPQRPVQTAPATPQPQRPAQTAPAAQPPRPGQVTPQAPQQRPAQTAPSAPPTQQRPAQVAPGQPARPTAAPAVAAPPPPQKPVDASRFIRKPGEAPARTLRDLKQERHETREGNRTIIREGDRTIVREGDRTIIRHSEADRFAVGARAVHEEHRGNLTVSIVSRPNGVRIINETDPEGHLVRRLRRDRDGRDVVIIDDSRFGPDRRVFLDLPPPRIHIPRDRYIVELDRAPPERIYETLIAPPVETVDQVYSISEVRYNAPLRALMPRVDLDINFETGSWQITPDQIEKLDVIARDLKRAVAQNPREVFMIEGHTDAVGAAEDNLSLSDRRAESVAVALTEQFGVPPENLVTQGYGEQDLKIPTQGPERANRRVAIRRITPLIDQSAQR
jgi:outer membrane protein OmpA-like peptidoglycan-associated protein